MGFFKNLFKSEESKINCIKNNKPVGKRIEYYENGNIKSEGNFIDGKEEGKRIYYHENGNIESEGNFLEGKPTGKRIEYYEDGNISREGTYKNGEGEGKWTEYYKSGKLEREANFKDGELEGKWIDYYEYGGIEKEGNFINGLPEGRWIYYFENGKKSLEGNYIKGKQEGKRIEYMPFGYGFNELYYMDGKEYNYPSNSLKQSEGINFNDSGKTNNKSNYIDGQTITNKCGNNKHEYNESILHYIGVQFESERYPGTFYGRTYAYKTRKNFHRWDIINVPTSNNGIKKARVVEENKDVRTIDCSLNIIKEV